MTKENSDITGLHQAFKVQRWSSLRACGREGHLSLWKAVKRKLYFITLSVGCLSSFVNLFISCPGSHMVFCVLLLVISTYSFILKALHFNPMFACLLILSILHNTLSLLCLSLSHTHTHTHTYTFTHTHYTCTL